MKTYTEEFKKTIVELYENGNKNKSELAIALYPDLFVSSPLLFVLLSYSFPIYILGRQEVQSPSWRRLHFIIILECIWIYFCSFS